MKNMRVCLSQVREYHSAYDNKYGAPSEGKPKVFVKYFYVNTATGEKSGDMLALAVLESD